MIITKAYRIKAYELVKDVDLKDMAFLSLNEFQNSILWTGDKKLINGLKKKKYTRVLDTSELIILRNKLKSDAKL